MQFLKKIPGEAPGPPPAGGGDPLPHPPPFGASRLSEAFGFICHLCPPPVEVLDPPLQNIDNFLKYMLVLNRPTSRPRLRANFSVCR